MEAQPAPIEPDRVPKGFGARWLAEIVRLKEAEGAVSDDGEALAAARAAPGEVERRIAVRAAHLAAEHGWAASWRAWRRLAGGSLLVAHLVALAGGFGTVASVLGLGSGALNVVWALFGLLGLPTLMLAIWLLTLLPGRAAGDGAALGRLWLWLARRPGFGVDAVVVARALHGLLARAGLTRWAFGAISHGLWSAALLGVLTALVLLLAAWRYDFVWETTILPPGAFVVLVEAVGWLPARLGFALPDPELVRASGGAAVAEMAARRAWAGWLTGAVLVWGLLPRLALLSLCLARLAHGLSRLRLDLSEPYYTALSARLAPASERLGVLDADNRPASEPRLAPPRAVASTQAALVALEWRETPPGWPPEPLSGVAIQARVDDRAARRRLLAQLAADPPARLLLVCDPRLSPDRGILALIAALSEHAGQCRVWLPDIGDDAERRRHWGEALSRMGLPDAHRYTQPGPALAWLAPAGARR